MPGPSSASSVVGPSSSSSGVGEGGGRMTTTTMIDLTLLDSSDSDSDPGDSGHKNHPPSSSPKRRGGPQHEEEGGGGGGWSSDGGGDVRCPPSGRTRGIIRDGKAPPPPPPPSIGRSPPPPPDDVVFAGRPRLPSSELGPGGRDGADGVRGEVDDDDDGGGDDFPIRYRDSSAPAEDASEDDGGDGDFPTRVRVRTEETGGTRGEPRRHLPEEANDGDDHHDHGHGCEGQGGGVVRRQEKSQRRRERERLRKKRRREWKRHMMMAVAPASSESSTGDAAIRGVDDRGGNGVVGHRPSRDADADADADGGSTGGVDGGHPFGPGGGAMDVRRREGLWRGGRLDDDDHRGSSMSPSSISKAGPTDRPSCCHLDDGTTRTTLGKRRRSSMWDYGGGGEHGHDEYTASTTPRRPRFAEPCRFFARGHCMRGAACWYRHGDLHGHDDDITTTTTTTTPPPRRKNNRGKDRRWNGDDAKVVPPPGGDVRASLLPPLDDSAQVGPAATGGSSGPTTSMGRCEGHPNPPSPSVAPSSSDEPPAGSTDVTDAKEAGDADDDDDVGTRTLDVSSDVVDDIDGGPNNGGGGGGGDDEEEEPPTLSDRYSSSCPVSRDAPGEGVDDDDDDDDDDDGVTAGEAGGPIIERRRSPSDYSNDHDAECIDLTGCDGVPLENGGDDDDDDWIATEIDLMLDVVEINLPRGDEMWEAVASDYNRSVAAHGARRRRSANQIRSMFESLVNSDGKSGDQGRKACETSDGSETVVSVIDIHDESSSDEDDSSGVDADESSSFGPLTNTGGPDRSAIDQGGVSGDENGDAVDVIFVKVVPTPAQVRLARRRAAAALRKPDFLNAPKLPTAPAPRPKLKFKPRPQAARKQRSRSSSTEIGNGSMTKEREEVCGKKRNRRCSTDASVSSAATDGVDVKRHTEKKHKTFEGDAAGATSVAPECSRVRSNGSTKASMSCDVSDTYEGACIGPEKPLSGPPHASEGDARVSTLNGEVDVKASYPADVSSITVEGEASSEAGGDSRYRAGPISSSFVAGGCTRNVGDGQMPSYAIDEVVVRFVRSDLFTKDGRQKPIGMKVTRVPSGNKYVHVVKSVRRGSPAEIKGVTVNLAICSINGHTAEHMNLMDAGTWQTELSNLANDEGGNDGPSLEICFRSLGASQAHTDATVNESTKRSSKTGDKNIPSLASTTRMQKDDVSHSSTSTEDGTTNGGALSQEETIDLTCPSELDMDKKTEPSPSSAPFFCANVAKESEERTMRAKSDANSKKTSKPRKPRKPKRKKPVNERKWTHYNFNKKNRQYSSTEAYRFSSGQDRHFHCPVEDALREQERLLSESAARVRGRMEAERLMALSSTSDRIRYFAVPVSNIRDLPDSHWTWSDPYSRLGLPRSSSALLVKRHYRKLALLYHPDKSRRPDALDRFHAVKEAYELLTKHGAALSQACTNNS